MYIIIFDKKYVICFKSYSSVHLFYTPCQKRSGQHMLYCYISCLLSIGLSRKGLWGCASGITERELGQRSQDSDDLKCSRVPKTTRSLNNLMEGFTELGKIHYTYGYDLLHQKDRLREGKHKVGTQNYLVWPPICPLPVGLCGWQHNFFLQQQYLKIHVEYCQQRQISPAVVGTWLCTCGWLLAWVTLVSSPFRDWVNKYSETFTTNHSINIGNLHVPKPPGKHSYSCLGKGHPKGLEVTSQGPRAETTLFCGKVNTLLNTAILFLALRLIHHRR